MNLTLSDYKTVLYYYSINYDKMKKNKIISSAEDILATKLCRCIKSSL